ncbi:ParB N-terminal domain-containing protein [Actinospica durhamensis]|uniref:ParB N-terminal domain-containing protein n=1 Tax=Actinospica durhamensis TaxID=1508375 RepID=A0A941ESM4_9ACTN|nr:ParB N-terminal domain-containing protein [Actinospica durhamensis]MBR7836438.1 ParB N-terminal domain-containing protein [Actinospica durhamensis]
MSDTELDFSGLPVLQVAIECLRRGFALRLDGCSDESVEVLSEVVGELPPILVHRGSKRVIDGMHRLLAARRRGLATIAVRYFEGTLADAFVLAVRANVAHGLPLPLRDRRVAAARILSSHPHWSNRRVATAAGLSDKTVAAIRARIGPEDATLGGRRVGADGRARPVDARARRMEVERLLGEDTSASLRRIAVRAGVSPETVRTVKAGLAAAHLESVAVRKTEPISPRRPQHDSRQGLHRLAGDPALRSTDAGRLLLRLLSAYPVLAKESDRLVDSAPQYALENLQHLAQAHADAWRGVAERAAMRRSLSDMSAVQAR